MKSFILTLILTAFTYAIGSIKINIDNKTITVTKKELANLYLMKTNTIKGIKVIPIDTRDKKLFKEFYRNIINKTPQQLRAYWMKEIYRGDKQPPKRPTASDIKKLLKGKTPVLSYVKNSKTGKIIFTIR